MQGHTHSHTRTHAHTHACTPTPTPTRMRTHMRTHSHILGLSHARFLPALPAARSPALTQHIALRPRQAPEHFRQLGVVPAATTSQQVHDQSPARQPASRCMAQWDARTCLRLLGPVLLLEAPKSTGAATIWHAAHAWTNVTVCAEGCSWRRAGRRKQGLTVHSDTSCMRACMLGDSRAAGPPHLDRTASTSACTGRVRPLLGREDGVPGRLLPPALRPPVDDASSCAGPRPRPQQRPKGSQGAEQVCNRHHEDRPQEHVQHSAQCRMQLHLPARPAPRRPFRGPGMQRHVHHSLHSKAHRPPRPPRSCSAGGALPGLAGTLPCPALPCCCPPPWPGR